MVIYGNNLAEKLFGIAISRDYLRYATPYCELVDDPDFIIDIDLAVDFNTALEGDPLAARRVVETLVLNSGLLDWSTIDFYVDKMMPHPYFQDEIRRINDIFNDPDFPNIGDAGDAVDSGAGGSASGAGNGVGGGRDASTSEDRGTGTNVGGGIPGDEPGNPVGFSDPGGQTGFPDLVDNNENIIIKQEDAALFNIEYEDGVYKLDSILTPGKGYSVGDVINITGDRLNGISPDNDLNIEITSVTTAGGVKTVKLNGSSTSGTGVVNVGDYGINGGNGSGAAFDISNDEGVYIVDGIADSGSNYIIGDKILISGNKLGGKSPANDVTLNVTAVDRTGSVLSTSLNGVGIDDIDIFTGVTGNEKKAEERIITKVSEILNVEQTTPVRVTTTAPHSLTTGQVVTLNGIEGSVELNGNDYYIDVINTQQFDIYNDPTLNDFVTESDITPYENGGTVTNITTPTTTLVNDGVDAERDIIINNLENIAVDSNPGTLSDPDDNLINNVNRADREFRNALQRASKDCVNSPCNIFAQTSDSIGRLAQNASSKLNENTFNLGGLKGIATDVEAGIDLALFNKMPGIFQRALVDVNTVAKDSWTKTQEAFVGKNKVGEVSKRGKKQGTMRGSTGLGKVYRYTPDIKNFFDFEQAGQKMMSVVSQTLGPCFDKFQVAYRYNPYTDNMSTPLGVNVMQVNGSSYTADPGGVYNSAGLSRAGSDDCGSLLGVYDASESAAASNPFSGFTGSGGIGGSSVLLGKGDEISESGSYWISKPLASKNAPSANGWPFLAGGYIDRANKQVIRGTVIQEGADKGDTNIPGIKTCPGYSLQDERFIDAKESNKLDKALRGKEKLQDKDLIVHKISNGWKHKVDEDGMTKHQKEPIFADGAITNKSIIDELLVVKNGLEPLNYGASIEKAIIDNKAFVVIRQAGQCARIVQIVAHMSKGTNSPTYGLTPAAYEYVFGVKPKGIAVREKNNNPDVKSTPWKFYKTKVKHKSDTEIRIAIGDYETIKSKINEELNCGEVEIPEGSGYISGKGGGCRNKPLHPDLEFILTKATVAAGCERVHLTSTGQLSKSDAIARGAVQRGSKWYINGKCVRTGSVRHDIRTLNGKTGGTAADFVLYKQGKPVSIKDNATWAKFSAAFIQLSKNMGYSPAAGAGPAYMGDTVVHFDIANMPSIWVDTSSGVPNSRKLATTPWLGVFQGQNPETFA